MEAEDGVITVSGGGIAERISQLGMQKHTSSQREPDIPKAMKLQESRIPYRSMKDDKMKSYPLRPIYRAAVGLDLSKNAQNDMRTSMSDKVAGGERVLSSKCDVSEGEDPLAMVPYRGTSDRGMKTFQPKFHSSPRVCRRHDQENVDVLNGEGNVMPSYKAIVMEQPRSMIKPVSSCQGHYHQELNSLLAQQNRSIFPNKTNQCMNSQLEFPCGLPVFRSKSDDDRRQQLVRTDTTQIKRLVVNSLNSADQMTTQQEDVWLKKLQHRKQLLQRQRQQQQEQQQHYTYVEHQKEDVWQIRQQEHHKRPRQEDQQPQSVQEHNQVKRQQQIDQQQQLEKEALLHESVGKDQQKPFNRHRQLGRQQLIEQQKQLEQKLWERQRQQQWLEQQRDMKQQRRIEQQRQLEQQIEEAWQMEQHEDQNHQSENLNHVQKQQHWEEEQQLQHHQHEQQQLLQQQEQHREKLQQIPQGDQQQPQVVQEESCHKKVDQLQQDKQVSEQEGQHKLHHQRMQRQQQLQEKRLKLQQHRQRYQQDLQQVEQQLQSDKTQLQEQQLDRQQGQQQLHSDKTQLQAQQQEKEQVEQQHQTDRRLKQYLQEQEHSRVLRQQVQEVQLEWQEQHQLQMQLKPYRKPEQQLQIHLKPQEQQLQQLLTKQLQDGAISPQQQKQQVQQHLHQRKLQSPTPKYLPLSSSTTTDDDVFKVAQASNSSGRNSHARNDYAKRHKHSASSSTSSVLDKGTKRQQRSHCDGQVQVHKHLPQSAKAPQMYYVLSTGELSDVDDTSSSSDSNNRCPTSSQDRASRPSSFPGSEDTERRVAGTTRSRHHSSILKPPRQAATMEDEEAKVVMDGFTYRHLMQDLTTFKTMLLKLRRVVQEEEIGSPFGSQPWKIPNGYRLGSTGGSSQADSLHAQDADPFMSAAPLDTLKQENVELMHQLGILQQQLQEKDNTIKLLQHQMTKYECGHLGPQSKVFTNAATQTDRPRSLPISKSVFEPVSTLPQSTSAGSTTCVTSVSGQTTKTYPRHQAELGGRLARKADDSSDRKTQSKHSVSGQQGMKSGKLSSAGDAREGTTAHSSTSLTEQTPPSGGLCGKRHPSKHATRGQAKTFESGVTRRAVECESVTDKARPTSQLRRPGTRLPKSTDVGASNCSSSAPVAVRKIPRGTSQFKSFAGIAKT